MLAALVLVLTLAAMPSIKEYGLKFLVSTAWRPNELEVPRRDPATNKMVRDADGEPIVDTVPPAFGALNVIYGTTLSSIVALLFAVPLSLGAAMFLVRVAPNWLVPPVSFLVEFLAAIPSIAYGLWGLFVLAPFLQSRVEPGLQSMLGGVPGLGWLFQQTADVGQRLTVRPIPLTGRDMFSGGLVLAVMIVPIITAISRDVLRGVPRAQVEGTVALGATWWQSCKEMLKYSRSGLFGAIMLGLARAAGETMAVTMVIGNKNQIEPSPFAPAQTMSSLLANEFAEATGDMHRAALVEVALVLLVMSLLFNVVARYLVVGKGARTAAAH
jgi:phosphate transport system permease protein